jgi:hypothetical protein
MTSIADRLRDIANRIAALEPPVVVEPPPVEPPPVVVPPPVAGTGLLYAEAATLQPGEWRQVETTWPGKDTGTTFKSWQYVEVADGMGWSERLVEYHGTLLFPLMRDKPPTALMVMSADGQWRRIEHPEGWSRTDGERRPFNRHFRDATYFYWAPSDLKTAMGYTLRTRLDSPGVFERYGLPIGDSQMDTVGNFSMCLSGWGRFFAYTPGGKLRSWAEGEPAWREHSTAIPKAERASGYAGTVIWHPLRGEIFAIGGQTFGDNIDQSDRIQVVRAPDAPSVPLRAVLPDGSPMLGVRSAQCRFLPHPTRPEYLCIYNDGVLYRSTTGEQWTVYQDLRDLKPWGAYEQYIPWTRLGDTDVIVAVSHIRGVWLHRVI